MFESVCARCVSLVVGPLVVMVDENTGSDAELAAEAFRRLGLGTVVGTRTWGGLLTVCDSYELIDGSEVSMPQQNVVLFQQHSDNSDGKAGGGGVGNPIENRGVVPDIEIIISPADHAAGRDTQLAAAVTEAVRLLGATPPPAPPISEKEAPAADLLLAAACEGHLAGGRWPFKTYAPYPEDGEQRRSDVSEDDSSDDDSSDEDDRRGRKGGRTGAKPPPKGARPRR